MKKKKHSKDFNLDFNTLKPKGHSRIFKMGTGVKNGIPKSPDRFHSKKTGALGLDKRSSKSGQTSNTYFLLKIR